MKLSDISYFASQYVKFGNEYSLKRDKFVQLEQEMRILTNKQEEIRKALGEAVSQKDPMRIIRIDSNYVMVIQWTSLDPILSIKQIEIG